MKYLYYVILIPYWILLRLDKQASILLEKDFYAYCNHFKFSFKSLNYYIFVNVLKNSRDERITYYLRAGKMLRKLHLTRLLMFIMPPSKGFHLGTNSDRIGGGLLIMHSWSTVVRAEKIGENLTIFQNVTIGGTYNPGIPIIGNNVTIWSGAVICGKITIGNNVTIGPNAVIFKDVADNTTMVSALSYELQKKK